MGNQSLEEGGKKMGELEKIPPITLMIGICVEPDGDRFHAYCPALKGVHVDGETEEEAFDNAKTATYLYIKSLIKHGEPIPIQPIRDEESFRDFTCPPKQTKSFLLTVH